MQQIKVIGFDADDTLWVNEPYYQDAEKIFCKLLEDYLPVNKISEELFKTEMDNLERYGYGAKAFILSMVETAIRISNHKVSPAIINEIIELGKALLEKPIELLDDVEFSLMNLKSKYLLVVATKGDLLDQQRKLNSSGLLHHFHHIEIMHDKNEAEYRKLLKRLNIQSEEFLMVGNSLKSDVLPVLSIGGQAIHIPYHITWQHEKVNTDDHDKNYHTISNMKELINILSQNNND